MVLYVYRRDEMGSVFQEQFKKQYQHLKRLDCRYMNEDNLRRDREPHHRDFSRVLYSDSFRRLEGKMQLLNVEPGAYHRNRLTHSLEVSQIARSLAHTLSEAASLPEAYQKDVYIIEAGALAHDIGNPPFGHKGEEALQEIMKDKGGFEGNAQGYRILRRLERKAPNYEGLNLMLRTYLSIVKYYRPYSEVTSDTKKRFLYDEDYEEISHKLTEINEKYEINELYPRTLDVQIIDIADEIAYCAHDLEDGLNRGYFDLTMVLYELKQELKKNECESNYKEFKQWVKEAQELAHRVNNDPFSMRKILQKELTSIIVHNLMLDVTMRPISEDTIARGSFNQYELGFKKYEHLANALKNVNVRLSENVAEVYQYEQQGKVILQGLYEAFSSDIGYRLLPSFYQKSNDLKSRYIVDYISGMTDQYAIQLYKKIYGESHLEGFLPLKK